MAGWPKGTSGNPGGRPAIAHLLPPGETATTATAKSLELLWTVMIAGPKLENDPNWRFATQMWLAYIRGKPTESVDLKVDGPLIDARMIALVEAARMTPHERRKMLDEPDHDGEPDEG